MQQVHLTLVSSPTDAPRDWVKLGSLLDGSTDDPYRLVLDQPAGLVRGEARGAWSVEQTLAYCAELEAVVAMARETCGRVRILLDRRHVSVQSIEVCAILAEANRTIFTGDDKIALVVSTSVAKVSLRQRMPHAGTKAFLSMSAAETWLSI